MKAVRIISPQTTKPSALQISSAFAVRELLVILLIVAILLALTWAALSSDRARSRRISCNCHLKQIGLSFRMWSNDHGEKFPFAVSTNKGGSLEFIGPGEVFRYYLLVSNELNSPRVLTCPSDKARTRTSDFAVLSDRNLSYFVGLDAVETNPQRALCGDRNISTNGRLISGILTVGTGIPVTWTQDLHNRRGNIGWADGSVSQVDDAGLKQLTNGSGLATRLAMP